MLVLFNGWDEEDFNKLQYELNKLNKDLKDERIMVKKDIYLALQTCYVRYNWNLETIKKIQRLQCFEKDLECLNLIPCYFFEQMINKGVRLQAEFNENSLNKIAKDLENIDDSNNERKLQLCDWKKEDYHSLMHIAVMINDKEWFNELSVKLNEVV